MRHHLNQIGDLFNANQTYLMELEVSTQRLNTLCQPPAMQVLMAQNSQVQEVVAAFALVEDPDVVLSAL